MNGISILLSDEKILDKKNRNLDSYYINENISPGNNNFSETAHNNISFNTTADNAESIFLVPLQTLSETRERCTSVNRIPYVTIEFVSPDEQGSNKDTIYEKMI